MKILAVSYCFPPLASAEAFVSARVLGGLADLGHKITVVTSANSRVHGVDRTAERLISSNLRLERVNARELPRIVNKIMHKICTPLLYMPDPMRGWAKPAGRCISDLLLKEKYDLIYSRAQPFTSHLAVLSSMEARNLPWVAHCSDPLVDNPFANKGKFGLHARLNMGTERTIFGEADQVHFTSQETMSLVARRYSPDLIAKFGLSNHSYGPELFGEQRSSAERGGPIVVAHIGSFTGERNPRSFLQAIVRLREREPALLEGVRVRFVGCQSAMVRRWVAQGGLARLVEIIPRVDYMESLRQMKESDVLLLIDAKFAGTSIFFPSKLVDYLGSGREILGISPESGTSARLLRELGRGPCAEPDDIEGIAQLLRAKLLSRANHERPRIYATETVAQDIGNRFTALVSTWRKKDRHHR